MQTSPSSVLNVTSLLRGASPPPAGAGAKLALSFPKRGRGGGRAGHRRRGWFGKGHAALKGNVETLIAHIVCLLRGCDSAFLWAVGLVGGYIALHCCDIPAAVPEPPPASTPRPLLLKPWRAGSRLCLQLRWPRAKADRPQTLNAHWADSPSDTPPPSSVLELGVLQHPLA